MKRFATQGIVRETEITARGYELDQYGHVNHAVYLNYFEHARFQAFRQGDFPPERMAENGWSVYVVRIEVDYLKEVRMGDHIRVRTWLSETRRTSMVIEQEMCRAAEPEMVVARARVVAVWIGHDRRPTRVPEAVIRVFQP
ncbi:MAG: acyl-CoA thioesterase [Gemmatimonadota bacterium]|nr:acyl-CoA thioesterase [Gemmatimonadota bacterium]